MKTDWWFKVEKLSRSLHLSRDVADEVLRELGKERCYDEDCEGQMEVCGTKGVARDIDRYPHSRETYYKCANCGKKWVYDFQLNHVAHW